MVFPLLLVLAAIPPLPKECEQPPVREVAPIKELANLDGAFSAGLDAVATWCFDSSGTWNAGVLGKPKKPIAADAPPLGDCLKAITSCESTFETVQNKAPLRELAANALLDFDRPYRGAKYVTKRSGLKEVPSQAANCRSKSRTELFAMAQQRMDVARLSSTVLNEYAGYKTWLFARGLECRNEIALNKKDPTKTGLAIDQTAVAAATPPPPPAPTAKDPEMAAALSAPMLDKWKYFSKLQARAETDRDFTLGFLASRELRTCDCSRVNPAAVVRALEKKEGGDVGASLLRAEDPANTRCAICMFEVMPLWSARAQKLCTSLDAMNDADLAKLEKSDDVNGVPPRCVEETKTRRAEQARLAALSAKAAIDAKALASARPLENPQAVRMPVGRDAGPVLVALAPVGTNVPAPAPTGIQPAAVPPPAAPDAGAHVAAAPNPNLQNVDGYTYYRPQPTGSLAGGNNAAANNPPAAVGSNPTVATTPSVGGPAPIATAAPAPTALTGPGMPTGPQGFTPPTSWAPIPQREDGRIYVRLFMSSSCVADVEPGPMQARTGDLLLLPFEAKALQVKSPCGGLAEVYFGREARPRVSETFGSNKPLKFEFKRQ